MNWIILIMFLYIAYYTFNYAKQVWKGGNKFEGVFIVVISTSLVGMPIWILFLRE
jgi:hypothetical protein